MSLWLKASWMSKALEIVAISLDYSDVSFMIKRGIATNDRPLVRKTHTHHSADGKRKKAYREGR